MNKVSVLLPVYNGAAYLEQAIRSIQTQTLTDFEFLIIDDGSTDQTFEIINSFQEPRIRTMRNETNRGLIFSLNRGLELAQGEYIARMDADDISCPERLKEQVDFMDGQPQVGICGVWARTFDDTNATRWETKFPVDAEQIKAYLLFSTALVHPSVMMRNSVFQKYQLRYAVWAEHAEDYELWSNAVDVTQLVNLPKMLLDYRFHPCQICLQHAEKQHQVCQMIRQKMLNKLGLQPTSEEMEYHYTVFRFIRPHDPEKLNRIYHWLKKIYTANRETNYCSPEILKKTFAGFGFPF